MRDVHSLEQKRFRLIWKMSTGEEEVDGCGGGGERRVSRRMGWTDHTKRNHPGDAVISPMISTVSLLHGDSV